MPVINPFNNLIFAWHYAGYLLKARHKKGQGIHSPFTYNLVTKVIFDNQHYEEYDLFRKIKNEFKRSQKIIIMDETGARSACFKKKRSIAKMSKYSSVNSKFGKLLFRLVCYFKPEIIVELGTSLGISSVCMSVGNSQSSLYTIEANEELCSIANRLFEKYKIENVKVIQGCFDEILDKEIEKLSRPEFVFIDGNHTYENTIRYFEYFSKRMEDGIIVFDDINWSKGMRKAWRKIIGDPGADITIDLFFMGIVLKRKSVTPGHYCVRF